MHTTSRCIAGLPQLDVHTLSEEWSLMIGSENHWRILAKSLGLKPSQWIDSKGDRMYAAVISLATWFDLEDTVKEDDAISAETELLSIRKPHSLSRTRFVVNGISKAEVRLLSSFVKRRQRGSNKSLSKVRDLWTVEDFDGDRIDALLDKHHQVKSLPDAGDVVADCEINRIQDFNAADLMYFKNFVRLAKAAEWRENRGAATRLNTVRKCYYFGNVEDGQLLSTKVFRDGDNVQTTHHSDDGRRIFVSLAKTRTVQIAER